MGSFFSLKHHKGIGNTINSFVPSTIRVALASHYFHLFCQKRLWDDVQPQHYQGVNKSKSSQLKDNQSRKWITEAVCADLEQVWLKDAADADPEDGEADRVRGAAPFDFLDAGPYTVYGVHCTHKSGWQESFLIGSKYYICITLIKYDMLESDSCR